ncbi:MAG TPA: S8 family serine peptidase, partial [Alphaproteobacteria bacterium]
ADIINFSCSGCATLADLQYIAGAGVLMTSAAGNTDFAPEPDAGSPAAYANQLDFSLIAVTGVHDLLGYISNYGYNSCGAQKEYCMAAYSTEGTSFAAPQIAGAAALVKEGWGYLTTRQVSQILLNSADDIGAPGVDAVYGHGILDMKAAMEPIGAVTVLNNHGFQSSFAPSFISQNQGTAFGNAFSASGNAKGNIVAIDSYGRDFNVKTENNLRVAYEDKFSADKLFALGRQKGQMKTINLNDGLSLKVSRQQKELNTADMVGYAEYDVAPAAKLKLGFATDMADVATNEMQKFNKNNFISQRSFENGYLNFSDNDQVFNQAIELIPAKNTKIKVSSYYSKNSNADYFKPVDNQVTSDFASSVVDTSFAASDKLNVNLRNGVTHEFDSVLGTQFTGSYEMQGGADTYFSGVDVSYDVAPNWNVFGSYTIGTTKATPSSRSAFSSISDLTSDSFSVAATRSEILGKDSLSFAVGQPTRVRSGVAKGLTQTVDRTTGAVSATEFEQSLTPTGRNMQFQAAYQKELSDNVEMNFALEYETNPYQQAEADAETSGFMKLIYQLN